MKPPVALVIKNLPTDAGNIRDTDRFYPWVGKIPWRRAWQPTLVFLPGNIMDRGAWQAIVHEVTKSQTRLSVHTHTHTRVRDKLTDVSSSFIFCLDL